MLMHEDRPTQYDLDHSCYVCLGPLFGKVYLCKGPKGEGMIHDCPSCQQHAEMMGLQVGITRINLDERD